MGLKKTNVKKPIAKAKTVDADLVEVAEEVNETADPNLTATVKRRNKVAMPSFDESLDVADEELGKKNPGPISEVEEDVEESRSEVVDPDDIAVETSHARDLQVEQNKTVSASPSPVGAGTLEVLGGEGFEGLEVGFGSFSILKIDTGAFAIDDEELEDVKAVDLIIGSSRAKYIFKEDLKDSENFVYSYDGVIDTSGKPVSAFLAKMEAAGSEVERKVYLEAVAEIVDEEDKLGYGLDGEFLLLSIPPSSLKRFSGYAVKVAKKFRCNPSVLVTRVGIGKKITKGQNSWHPWTFKAVKKVSDLNREDSL